MQRQYIIIDKAGLHARPASLLVQAAMKFSNDIFITYKERKVSLKSILGVMSLGVFKNSSIEIEVNGENQVEVFNTLEKVFRDYNLVSL